MSYMEHTVAYTVTGILSSAHNIPCTNYFFIVMMKCITKEASKLIYVTSQFERTQSAIVGK